MALVCMTWFHIVAGQIGCWMTSMSKLGTMKNWAWSNDSKVISEYKKNPGLSVMQRGYRSNGYIIKSCMVIHLQPTKVSPISQQEGEHYDYPFRPLTWQACARLMPTRKRADMPGGKEWDRLLPRAGSITRRHFTTASTMSSLEKRFTLCTSSPTSLCKHTEHEMQVHEVNFSCVSHLASHVISKLLF